MLAPVVQSLFATLNLKQYDLSVLKSLNLPQSLLDAIDEAQAMPDLAERGSLKLKAGNGFDDWSDYGGSGDDYGDEGDTSYIPPADLDPFLLNPYAGTDLFSRTEPYNFDEQRAIDQKGFLYPDYCVCRRPDLI